MTSKISQQLIIIREMCNWIIYHTFVILNDGNIDRLKLIENEILNIKDSIQRIKDLSN